MNEIYMEDFFRLGNHFVRFYKTVKFKCQRPNTFAVLEEFEDLNTDNLNKTLRDKMKVFYYSRLWDKNNYNPSKIEFEHPVLAMFERTFQIKGLFKLRQKETSGIEIAYLDQYHKTCAMDPTGDECKDRTRNEIYSDTKIMLFNFVKYLKESKYYDGDQNGLYHPEVITHIDEGATVNDQLTRQFQHALSQNDDVTFERWEGGFRDLYGFFFEIKLPFARCNSFEYISKQNKQIDRGDQHKN